MAATLANGGICPLTGQHVFEPSTVRNCLSLMATCGMYDYSGEWNFRVGIPAKSGVSGAIWVVVPEVGGFCAYSPPVDAIGNSRRGVEVFKALSDRFAFHMLEPSRLRMLKVDPTRPVGFYNEGERGSGEFSQGHAAQGQGQQAQGHGLGVNVIAASPPLGLAVTLPPGSLVRPGGGGGSSGFEHGDGGVSGLGGAGLLMEGFGGLSVNSAHSPAPVQQHQAQQQQQQQQQQHGHRQHHQSQQQQQQHGHHHHYHAAAGRSPTLRREPDPIEGFEADDEGPAQTLQQKGGSRVPLNVNDGGGGAKSGSSGGIAMTRSFSGDGGRVGGMVGVVVGKVKSTTALSGGVGVDGEVRRTKESDYEEDVDGNPLGPPPPSGSGVGVSENGEVRGRVSGDGGASVASSNVGRSESGRRRSYRSESSGGKLARAFSPNAGGGGTSSGSGRKKMSIVGWFNGGRKSEDFGGGGGGGGENGEEREG
ncbi:hypothetical protein HDU76_001872 [Blyttiomyces sp. JEL0837]|nr:hypothetical protein HDU76_001872 [Blyttiomyces sp. JEL0837]